VQLLRLNVHNIRREDATNRVLRRKAYAKHKEISAHRKAAKS
jgi:hypothetical protein